ncbi:hypothetical protein QVD17_00050 [Tagetes erecta]|uniref:Uncharacterized protein n=1 Tax=Tagetes erecta TaxID=13708 RepID=A0AAD8P5H9_TARER|nr:hypothetical protein QVD17_00050 [Tagetes erecta]
MDGSLRFALNTFTFFNSAQPQPHPAQPPSHLSSSTLLRPLSPVTTTTSPPSVITGHQNCNRNISNLLWVSSPHSVGDY